MSPEIQVLVSITTLLLLVSVSAIIISIWAIIRSRRSALADANLSDSLLSEAKKILEEAKELERKMPDHLDQAAARAMSKVFGNSPEKVFQDPAIVSLVAKKALESIDSENLSEEFDEALKDNLSEIVSTLMANPPDGFMEAFRTAVLKQLENELESISENIVTNGDGWEDGYNKVMNILESTAPEIIQLELSRPDSELRKKLAESLSEQLMDKINA